MSSNGPIGEPTFDLRSMDTITEFSSDPTSAFYSAEARGDQVYHVTYSDTFHNPISRFYLDAIEQRPHKPIGISVSQTSISYTAGYARRFVIVDNWIKNISGAPLKEVAIGVFLWPGVGNDLGGNRSPDDLCGLIRTVPVNEMGLLDTIMLAWAADNDGDPDIGRFSSTSATSVVGIRPLRIPPGCTLSFNWWVNDGALVDWGPRHTNDVGDFGGRLGTPMGDRSRYRVMVNREIDYDQLASALPWEAENWKPAPYASAIMRDIADGNDVRFIMSASHCRLIMPGDSVPFTFAVVLGSSLHPDADNYARNFDYNLPQRFLTSLDFTDLLQNARWSDWVFDTPGIDTDGDGFAGRFYLDHCLGTACDTVWYGGDGVPDWGGTRPPPPPAITLETVPHQVTIRWSGEVSEIARDLLSGRRDFEGYRLYSARTNNAEQFSLIASWDLPDNYYRVALDPVAGEWHRISYGLSVAEWRTLLADANFHPRDYDTPSFSRAYRDSVVDTLRASDGSIISIDRRDRLSFWLPEGPNHANTYSEGGRLTENRIRRVAVRDTVIGEDTLQYGFYEATIDNLNAAIPLWFSVTSFDHGDYRRNVESLESGPGVNAQFVIPVYSSDVVEDSGLEVTVYPNPYKISFLDGMGNLSNYYAQGYEAFEQPVMSERERRIWFANLPDTATIRIYSLDGDLIREIHHPDKFLTRYSSVVGWDLISRNTQAVVSGIYIWRVDSRLGSQVGKIVIIK